MAGAARLIEVRGSNRFESEFEKALLVAQIGPTVSSPLTSLFRDLMFVCPAAGHGGVFEQHGLLPG
jgi:hypothetical protein